MNLQELFADEKRWCKRAMARDIEERCCDHLSPDAQSYCLLGSIYKIYGYDVNIFHVMQNVRNKIQENISIWNDCEERTIEDIRNLVKELNI